MTNPFDQQAGPPPDFVVEARRPAASTSAKPSAADLFEEPGQEQPARARRGGRRARAAGAAPAPERPDRDSDPHDVARAIALKQLTMAPRSRRQLADKLRQKGCDDEVAARVLDRLEEVGLIDDEAYAAMLVRSQQAGRGLARRALQQELRRKGIDDETVTASLEEIDDEDERERARALVAKKLRSMHGLDATVQTRRLAGMLARKGYPSSLAFAVIREAIADAPEHQRD